MTDHHIRPPGYGAAAATDPFAVQSGPPVPAQRSTGYPIGPPPQAYLPFADPIRPLGGFGATAVALLCLQALCAVVSAAVAGWAVIGYADLSATTADVRLPADAAAAGLRILVVGPLTLLTALVFVGWLFRASSNVRLAGTPIRHAPGWAIGAWFVPLLNLWRPKQMVDDVYRGSDVTTRTGTDLRLVQKPLMVVGWWTSWLLGQALVAIAAMQTVRSVAVPQFQAALAGQDPEAALAGLDFARIYEAEAMWQLWSSIFTLIAAVLAAVIVARVTGWQSMRLRGIAEPPPPHVFG